ncbi:GntR family transcriptional regulator [Variovorax sp. NFACC27]|uniref:GntR family transcriptional regulator n=1 Tax=Variovorax gossypii TaxID=1679495 RepID=A0A3S0J2J3_9BURK|nr:MULTISPECIES: GntR family transcriptional regulator [Variovorax]MDP9606698.1 DNA-binding GntR family transcriptional regulator [Variovorax paradoxus]RTQ31536.1 GntR family transcriptional regulator [Variovorax gossypii]SEL21697.1 transcriptional regulator, GntR family [Variovorax sp. YR750]SFC37431.1 DNA-binding transcriptional regulator, GntR family [Variovorax sp. NFACC26]
MSASPKIRLDRTRLAAPQVLEKLREAILALELVPGTVLQRQELADRFGVSQTPVREALLRLNEEGLVDVFPQHATLVSRIDISAAREAHFLRRSIELELVHQLAVEESPGLVDQLKGVIAQQAALATSQRYGDFVNADRAFHRLMYEAGGVLGLWDLVGRVSGHVDRLRRLHLPTAGKTEAILRDHRAITRAIEAKDPDAAQAALRKHLSGTLSAVNEICKQYPDYVIP